MEIYLISVFLNVIVSVSESMTQKACDDASFEKVVAETQTDVHHVCTSSATKPEIGQHFFISQLKSERST